MGLFRWNYIVPRLVVLFLLLCASEIGVGLAIKWSLVSYGAEAVGARVDVAGSKASLLKTHVTLTGIEVADPSAPMTNLFAADVLELRFDPDALLRKKAVVEQGVLRGVRFGGERSVTGQLAEIEQAEESPAVSWLGDATSDPIEAWLDQVESRVSANAADGLMAPVVAEQLRQEWPRRAANLQASAAELESRIETLQASIQHATKNPLRSLDVLREAPNEVAQLTSELNRLREEIQGLPQQAASDRQCIAEARRNDEALIREKLNLGGLDAEQLTGYLLGDELSGSVAKVVDTVLWLRKLAPENAEEENPTARGVDMLFAGCRQIPDVLVRRLDISGSARIGNQPVEIKGQLTDFTTNPVLHGAPLKVHLAATNGMPFTLDATLDRTGDRPRDHVIAGCDALLLPGMMLGDETRLGLEAPSTLAALKVDLRLDGDALDGEIRIQQDKLELRPRLDRLASGGFGRAASASLTRSLSRPQEVTTTVTLGGSLQKPSVCLHSTLGETVASAIRAAGEEVVASQTERLLAESQQRLDAELAKLDAIVAQVTADLGQQIGEQASVLQQLAAGPAGKALGEGGVLGVGSRLGLPLRQ